MNTYVIGDVHGAYKAMIQCFEKANFDYENDKLISLGDVCDGWPEVDKVFDELLKIKNLVYILGNHDYWTLEWIDKGDAPQMWLNQGGSATIECYKDKMPESHYNLLKSAKYYHIEDNKVYIHGGFAPDGEIDKQDPYEFLWDRSLVTSATHLKTMDPNLRLSQYSEIYIGHTPTINYNNPTPIKACEVWLMDTGAGWPGGVLSLMNVDTKELFQSDPVDSLYPNHKGRVGS